MCLISQHSPHWKPVVPDAVVRADIVGIEVEVATVVGVARTERGRPIVATQPNAIEALTVATARSREENVVTIFFAGELAPSDFADSYPFFRAAGVIPYTIVHNGVGSCVPAVASGKAERRCVLLLPSQQDVNQPREVGGIHFAVTVHVALNVLFYGLNIIREILPTVLSFIIFYRVSGHIHRGFIEDTLRKSLVVYAKGGLCQRGDGCDYVTARKRRFTDALYRTADGDARQASTPPERIFPDGDHRVGDSHARQTETPRERITPDADNGIADGHARQTATTHERTLPDAGHGVGDVDARQATTTIERKLPDARHTVWDNHARQATTVMERTITNAGHRVGDDYARQATTFPERFFPDAGHAVGDNHARQAATTIERILLDAGHRVGDDYARQFLTALERHITNAGDAIGDDYARQANTAIERPWLDAGHIISYTIVGDFFWNYNRSRILVWVARNCRLVSF